MLPEAEPCPCVRGGQVIDEGSDYLRRSHLQRVAEEEAARIDLQFFAELVDLVEQGVELLRDQKVPEPITCLRISGETLTELEFVLLLASSVSMLWRPIDPLAFEDLLGTDKLKPFPARPVLV